jgi:hypothetical protein
LFLFLFFFLADKQVWLCKEWKIQGKIRRRARRGGKDKGEKYYRIKFAAVVSLPSSLAPKCQCIPSQERINVMLYMGFKSD